MAVIDRRLGGATTYRGMESGERGDRRQSFNFFGLLDLLFSFFYINLFFITITCHVIGGRNGCTKRVVHESFSKSISNESVIENYIS
jgi:hypothetical protein